MASEEKGKLQLWNTELNKTKEEQVLLSEKLRAIRVLKQQNEIDILQTKTALRQIRVKQEKECKLAQGGSGGQGAQSELIAGPSRRPHFDSTLRELDLDFLDDPAVVNKVQLNLDIPSKEEFMDTESEVDD